MKKNKFIILFTILILIIFTIDSINYLEYYNEGVEYLISEGREIPKKSDCVYLMERFIVNGYSSILVFIFPLIMILISTEKIFKKINSGYIKHEILKEGYFNTIKKYLLGAWRHSFFALFIMFTMFIFAAVTCGFNFIPEDNFLSFVPYGLTPPKPLPHLINMILLCLNLFFISFTFINIGFINILYNKNFYISSILSYIYLTIYQIYAGLGVGPSLRNMTGDTFFTNGLTFLNFWGYDPGVTPLKMFLYAVFLFLVTFGLIVLSYRNEEKVVMRIEK